MKLFDPIWMVFGQVIEIVTRLFESRPEKPETRSIFAEDVTPNHVGQARPSRRLRIEIHANGSLNLLTSPTRETIDTRNVMLEAILIQLKQSRIGRQGPGCISGRPPMRESEVNRDTEERN